MTTKTLGFLLAIGCPIALSFLLPPNQAEAGNATQYKPGELVAQSTAAAASTPAATSSDNDSDDADSKPAVPEKPKSVQSYHPTAASTQAPVKESAEMTATAQKVYAEIGKGNNKEALSLISDALKKEPTSILARRYYAFALVHNDSPRSAIEQILYQLPRLPGYQRTSFDWCTLGDAYLQASSFDNADISYNTVLKTEPENHSAKGGLLRTLAKRGKADEAIKQCDALIAQYSQQPSIGAYYKGLRALLVREKGQPATPDVAPSDSNDANSAPSGGTIPELPSVRPLGG